MKCSFEWPSQSSNSRDSRSKSVDHNNGSWNLGRSSSAGGGIVAASAADAAGSSWRAAQNSTSEESPSTRVRQSTWNKVKGAFKPTREEQAKAKPAAAAAGNYPGLQTLHHRLRELANTL